MSTIADHSGELEETIQIVPVFPLPDTVFFPLTSLPLHIFEPRYRAMVRDVTAGDGRIVVSRMLDNDFEKLGTVGRIVDVEPLEDGRSNIRLEGLERVSMTEIPCDTPYRQVRITPRPELAGTADTALIERAKLDLLATLGILLSVARQTEPVVLQQDLPFEVVVNMACAGLPVDASLRQRLLAEDDLLARQRRVSDHLAIVIDALSEFGEIDQDGRSALN